MSIYDINYDTKAVEWLPPDKRNPKMVGLVRALFAEIKYMATKVLTNYRTGGSYPAYAPNGVYSAGSLVVQKQVVYQSLVDNNSTVPPSSSWAQYLPSFIGVDTRVKFNGIKLTLEYALNDRFGTNFRQPVSAGSYPGYDTTGGTAYIPGNVVTWSGASYVCIAATSGPFNSACWHTFTNYPLFNTSTVYTPGRVVTYGAHIYVCQATTTLGSFIPTQWKMEVLYPHVSDIYITGTPYGIIGFIVGQNVGSTVGLTGSSGDIGPSSPFYQPYMFNIMVPVAVYNALNANGGAVAEITGFVTPLCPAGATFSITHY